MYAVPGEKENKTGLLSYGNGDEEKRTHSLAEGAARALLQFSTILSNSLQFSAILSNFLQFPIIFNTFL